jgi:hypothetical protein
MKKFLPFEAFKKSYNKLKDEEKHEVFYYSLFDISDIAQYEETEIKNERKRIEKEIMENVPKVFKSGKFKKESREDFIRRNVYTDRLCKYIIAVELEKKGIRLRIPKSSEKFDLLLNNGIVIEIKRIVGGTAFGDYIIKDIEEKYKNNENRLLLILIFPQFGGENFERVSRLIEIYYITEKYLSERLKGKTKVVCQYITKKQTEEYSLWRLIERLEENIKSF